MHSRPFSPGKVSQQPFCDGGGASARCGSRRSPETSSQIITLVPFSTIHGRSAPGPVSRDTAVAGLQAE